MARSDYSRAAREQRAASGTVRSHLSRKASAVGKPDPSSWTRRAVSWFACQSQGENHGMGILVETVQEQLAAALRYAAWVLDHVDPTQRLSRVVVAAHLTGGFAMRTRREHEASPTSVQLSSSYGRDERVPVHLSPAHLPRAGLTQQARQIVEDLVTLIRRQWRS